MKEEELKVNTFLILEGYQSGTLSNRDFRGGTSLHTLSARLVPLYNQESVDFQFFLLHFHTDS